MSFPIQSKQTHPHLSIVIKSFKVPQLDPLFVHETSRPSKREEKQNLWFHCFSSHSFVLETGVYNRAQVSAPDSAREQRIDVHTRPVPTRSDLIDIIWRGHFDLNYCPEMKMPQDDNEVSVDEIMQLTRESTSQRWGPASRIIRGMFQKKVERKERLASCYQFDWDVRAVYYLYAAIFELLCQVQILSNVC